MHYVKYGLEDLSEDNPLGFTYIDTTLNYLRITNFKEMSLNSINVRKNKEIIKPKLMIFLGITYL